MYGVINVSVVTWNVFYTLSAPDMQMKQRTRELWRKVSHILIGTGCLIGAYVIIQRYGTEQLNVVLGSVLALLLITDILIADYGWNIPLYHQLQREHEEQGLHTATLGFLGSVIAYNLFVLPVAIAAIGMLIYGDAAAAITGLCTRAGRRKKHVHRVIAMLVVSVAIGWLVFGWIGAVMGVVATLAECLVTKVDDALTIPLLAGIAGQLLWIFYGL